MSLANPTPDEALIHVSWEATGPLGGIGVVLENLITSAPYREQFPRTILVSPSYLPMNAEDFYDCDGQRRCASVARACSSTAASTAWIAAGTGPCSARSNGGTRSRSTTGGVPLQRGRGAVRRRGPPDRLVRSHRLP